MTRLLQTIKLDATIQYRNKLYHIALGVALLLVVLSRLFIDRAVLAAAIPSYFMMAVGGTTFMFVAGMIIFEKDEHTLASLIVSPLTIREYLASKTISLSFIAIVESTIVVLIAYGFGFNGLFLYSGLIFLAFMMVLLGIVAVVPFNSVTDFLVPATGISLITQLPLFLTLNLTDWLDIIWYAIPTAAPYMLMLRAFAPEIVSDWQVIYGFVYSLVSLAVLGFWAHTAFNKHIVERIS